MPAVLVWDNLVKRRVLPINIRINERFFFVYTVYVV